jgi:hypothetical protein
MCKTLLLTTIAGNKEGSIRGCTSLGESLGIEEPVEDRLKACSARR